jgi:hypothetical protein
MAASKTKATNVSVAEFLAAKAAPAQLADCKELIKLFQGITGKPPKMWGPSIVGFDAYHYVYESGREGDAPQIGFAIRARELVVYLSPQPRSQALLAKLGKHKAGAGCVYFKTLDEIDRQVLKELSQASVEDLRRRYP